MTKHNWNYYFMYNKNLPHKLVNRVTRSNKSKKNVITHTYDYQGHIHVNVAKSHYKLQNVIYEMFNGSIPYNHSVTFKDCDDTNFNKENLILVSHSELSLMRSKPSNKKDEDLPKGVSITKDGYYRGAVRSNGERYAIDTTSFQEALEFVEETRDKLLNNFHI